MQPAINDNEVGARLSAVRETSGLSQTDFAQRLGISLRAYQTYERAERELPMPVAIRLYQEFQINPLWLTLGEQGGSRQALSSDDAARLCWELYEQWEKAINGLTPKVPYEIKKTLHRKLARRTYRDARIPSDDIAETVRDLKS